MTNPRIVTSEGPCGVESPAVESLLQFGQGRRQNGGPARRAGHGQQGRDAAVAAGLIEPSRVEQACRDDLGRLAG